MEYAFLWVLCSILIGVWYGTKGGSGAAGFLLSLLLSPLLAAILVALSSPGEKCPHCRERVKMDASICPHCRGAIVWLTAKERRARIQ